MKSTKVYIVMWDTDGYGFDTVAGAFWDEFVALQAIDDILINYPTGRYVRADFKVVEKEVE